MKKHGSFSDIEETEDEYEARVWFDEWSDDWLQDFYSDEWGRSADIDADQALRVQGGVRLGVDESHASN